MARGRVYNRFFDEDKWSKVNKLNKEIMQDYIAELKQNQKKKGTIDQYTNDWKIVFLVIYDNFNNKSILELTKKDWRRLSLYFKESCEHSNARVNRLMSAVRSMLSYCEDDDDYDYNVSTASKVKGMPKEKVRDIVFLTNEQIIKLKNELIKRKEYQKATVLMLAYDSAGRKNELFQVKKESFLNSELSTTNKVIGKRGKDFKLVYFSGTKECANLYLEQRGEDDIESMWITGIGDAKREIDVDTIYNWFIYMNNLLEELEGVKIGFNVHSLRHSSLEQMSQSVAKHYALKEVGRPDGLTLEELQLHANHSDVSTTQSYLKDKTDELKLSMFNLQFGEED